MVGLLHRGWRALPAGPRRAVVRQVAEWLAPRPDAAPEVAAGVAVVGEFDRASGLGEGARLHLVALRQAGVPCWEAGPGRAMPPAHVPLVLHANPAALPLALLRLGAGLVRGRRIVGVWPWELEVVPLSWRMGFRFVHEVWAPSAFSARAIGAAAPAGFPTVRVVPHPVACRVRAAPARAAVRARLGVPEGVVVTLVAFSLASSLERKNPLAAIAAHRAAFGDRADRVLIVRMLEPGSFPADAARVAAAVAGATNMRLDTRTLARHEADGLMEACDIVLSLHRSEGFGLVVAEAMALGRPVVATDWSATAEFVGPGWGVPVGARLVPAVDGRGVFEAPGAVWAEADVAAAAAALVRLADDAGLRAAMGTAGQREAAARFGAGPLLEAVRALGVAH